ncbi:MAG: Na/Pi cotransporter family protein [Spirochaetes bacterium]|nr:Na/Pi cotransporter family protein [Spirochaetota bacterium]
MNFTSIANIAGGIGLFLLGMFMSTEGLRMLAGDSLRRILSRFTGGSLRSISLGAALTILVQSSHVTTIATIGFVSAGLITFQQSLGIIFGANLGTTSIGWIISLLGFKLKIGLIAMIAVAIGATMKLVFKNYFSKLGFVIAGFGLIFIGIDFLQNGMSDFGSFISISNYVDDSIFTRLKLVGIGIIMTVIAQSSGAALTITLAAVHLGQISVEHAAAMVIGQNIGSTLTAAVAAFGASSSAKKTALAHIFFNLFTGIILFVILNPFVVYTSEIFSSVIHGEEVIAVSLFHTAFNFVGIIIFLPFIKPFSKFLSYIIPSKKSFTENLDKNVEALPAVAVESARRSALEIVSHLCNKCILILRTNEMSFNSAEIKNSTAKIAEFMSRVRMNQGIDYERKRKISLLHAVEHIDYLSACADETETWKNLQKYDLLKNLREELADELDKIIMWIQSKEVPYDAKAIESVSERMIESRKKVRAGILEALSRGEIESEEAFRQIEALRWLERLTYRIWRSVYYLID